MGTLRIEHLIAEARALGKNTNYGDNSGISQRLALIMLNTALKRVWRKIVANKASVFIKKSDQNITAGTSLYDLPLRTFTGYEIIEVQWSPTGQAQDYYTLNGPCSVENRDEFPGSPDGWGYLNGQIFLTPLPNVTIASGLRIYYREEMPILDIRRGVTATASTVFNTSSLVFTTGPLMNPAITATFDPTGADDRDYLCIVDKDGAFKVRNIRIDSINATSGAITVTSGWTGTSTDTAVATADYFTCGYNATTHSPLDGELDEFLKWSVAAAMAGYDKDEELAGTCQGMADDILKDLTRLYAPSHHKGRRNIKGFNDIGNPYDWY